MLIDSGASHTMVTNKNLLADFQPWTDSHFVTLADGHTKTPIIGQGTLHATSSNGSIISIPNCLYVPALSKSLLATKAFSLLPHHSISTIDGTTTINFPSFSLTTDDSYHEPLIYIKLYEIPSQHSASHLTRDQEHTLPTPPTNSLDPHPELISTDTITTNSQTDTQKENPMHTDNSQIIPEDIHNTLNKMDISPTIPTWLRAKLKVSFKDNNGVIHRGVLSQTSLHRWTLILRKSKRQVHTLKFSTQEISDLHDKARILPGHQQLLSNDTQPQESEPDLLLPKPPLPTHDIPISSIPNDVSFTTDQLQRRFGFRNIHNILTRIKETSMPNFSISSHDNEPIIDLGNTATVDKSKRNTTPITLPQHFGQVVHMDILYGSSTAHGQIKYALYFIDRTTRYKAIYPLKDLSKDIFPAIKQFCSDFQQIPSQFICDCDQRLFSQQIQDWLTENNSRINSAPEGKQRQNGLAEGTWRTILKMARG